MQQYSGFFLGSEIAQGDVDEALFHVIPVPYEASVSYGGGTAAGPQAIIHASDQLETFDGVSEPCELGIHTHAAVDCRGEAADVLFHLTVLLAAKGIPLERVMAELARREGTSGLAEKAARG